jgi:hypothetical protein
LLRRGLFGSAIPIFHDPREEIVTVGEDVGAHRDALADGALDRKAASIDLRPDALDDDATAFPRQIGRALTLRLNGGPRFVHQEA